MFLFLQGQSQSSSGNKPSQISAIGRSSEPTSRFRSGSRYGEMHNEKRQMRREQTRANEVKNEHLKRGNRETPQESTKKPPQRTVDLLNQQSSEATDHPDTFAQKIIKKLNKYLQEKESDELVKEKLKKVCDLLNPLIHFRYVTFVEGAMESITCDFSFRNEIGQLEITM